MLEKNTAEVTVTLPSDREICFTRTFDRPRHLLFAAWTQPEHLRNWWGCDGSQLLACEIDLRVGGEWHFLNRLTDGSEHSFRGVYREIVPNERLVYTECYEMPSIGNPEWLTTINFEDDNGKTRLTHRILHKSKEVRDGHLQAGMKGGAIQSLNRLDVEVAAMAEEAAQAVR
jgi:uncharacterized protein YndB with AHSA1/START domain